MIKIQILFDQFSKYKACSDILDIYGPLKDSLLDIGSGLECLLGNYVDNYEVSYLDPMIEECQEKNQFKGDNFNFKFQDYNDFNCLTAIDVI